MLSEKPWKIDAVMLLGSAIFFCLFATVSVGVGLDYFLPNLPMDDKKFYNFLANTLGFHGMTLVLLTPFLKFHGTNWSEFLGLDQPQLAKRILFGLGIGVLLVPSELGINKLSAEFITWLQMTPEPQPTMKVLQVSVSAWKRVSFGATAILLAPLTEEALFRGVLYPFLKQLGRPQVALYGTSLLFALIHANLMTFVPLFIFALIMVWLYETTDTLVVPILAHALFNAANFALYLYESSLPHG